MLDSCNARRTTSKSATRARIRVPWLGIIQGGSCSTSCAVKVALLEFDCRLYMFTL